MKMKVVDQLHISSLGPNTMPKGHEFEVSDAEGEALQKRGLAIPVAPAAAAEKAEAAPPNKAERPPLNKSAPKARKAKGRKS